MDPNWYFDNGLGNHPRLDDTARLRLTALADGGNPGGSGGGSGVSHHASPGHASTGTTSWTAASSTAVNQLTQVVSIQGATADRGHGPQTLADASLLAADDGSGGSGESGGSGGANEPPAISAPSSGQVLEDGQLTFPDNADLISISDPDAGAEFVQVILSAMHGTLSLSGNAGLNFLSGDGTADPSMTFEGSLADINAALNGLVYQPEADFFGADTLSVLVDDLGNSGSGGAQQASASVDINVEPVNDAPSFTPGPDVTVAVNAGPQTIAGWASNMSPGPANESAQSLTFVVIDNSNPLLFADGPAIDEDTGDLSFTPATDASGSAIVALVLMDDGGSENGGRDTSETRFFLIAVGVENHPPIFAGPGDQILNQVNFVSLSAAAMDPDSAVLSYAATGLPEGLSIDASSGLISGFLEYRAPATYAATVTASDGQNSASTSFNIETVIVLETGQDWADEYPGHASTIYISNTGQGTVQVFPQTAFAGIHVYEGNLNIANGPFSAGPSRDYVVAIEGRNGFAGDASWTGDASTLDFSAKGNVVSVQGSVSDEFRAQGAVQVTAGQDIISLALISENDQVVADAGRSVQVQEAKAKKSLWVSARDGSATGSFTSEDGWVYVWAKEDVDGKVSAKQVASVTAWNDLKADVSSESDGVEAFAGRNSSGKLHGKSWVDLEARGDVSGQVSAGDTQTWGDVVIRAGGNLTQPVTASGTADVAAQGSVTTDVTGQQGWISVVANNDINGRLTAGEEAKVWAGGKVGGSVAANLDIDVVAGGSVDGWIRSIETFEGPKADVSVWSGADITARVTASRNAYVEAIGQVTGDIIASGDVSVIANGNITGKIEAEWVADVRSSGGQVTGDVRTRREPGELLTSADSPTKKRLDVIASEITRLTQERRAARPGDRAAIDQQIANLEVERELHSFVNQKTVFSQIPAQRIRDLLADGLAKEWQGPAITLGEGLLAKTYQTSGYVAVADVVGDQAYVMLLEPYKVHKKELFGGVVTEFETLLGKNNAAKKADYYKVVQINNSSYSVQPKEARDALLSDQIIRLQVISHVTALHADRANDILNAVEFGARLIPLVGAIDEFAQGNYWEAGISLASDLAMFAGFGAAKLARNCHYAGTRWVKLAAATSLTAEGSVVAARLGQGFHALGAGNTADALGYFGDATLRLLGLSVQAVSFLRKPKCFVAGTLVHTERGPRPIEQVEAGQAVWAFGRQRGEWRLAKVTRTFQRTSHLLTTVRLSDSDEITGTDGHPFWVIEGQDLGTRPVGDHGADEQPGRAPGRWVAMAALQAGDLVLVRTGQVRRVVSVQTCSEAVPVYNLEVEALHTYAVGESGVLVHNAQNYSHFQNTVSKELGDTPTNPAVRRSSTPAGPEPSQPGGQRPGSVEPSAGTAKPTTQKNNLPYTVTENAADAYRRKPQLPQGGKWKNADGTDGLAGESFWHGPDPTAPCFPHRWPQLCVERPGRTGEEGRAHRSTTRA